MAQALLHVALGPVQDFIAAARRTRDLWFGSHVLSEVSKAAARAIRDACPGGLVYPVPDLDGRDVLAGADGMFQRVDGALALTIPSPNKLWAVVPAAEADAIASAAHAAAKAQWKAFADKVRGRDRPGDRLIDPARVPEWHEQVDRLLEVFAAWRPLPDDGDDAFVDARSALMGAVEEAKTLRAFTQWSAPRGAPRQSSLDAERYGVLARDAHDQRSGRRYRIAGQETLSAVDLVKRAGGEPEQFVPVTNIALAPWHAAARESHPKAWQALEGAMGAFADAAGKDVHGFDRTGKVPRETLEAGCWTMLFDAQIFLENRARKTLEEAIGPYGHEKPRARPATAVAAEAAIAALLGAVRRPPVPYVACLMADGDGLGKVLEGLGPDALVAASKELCRFSVAASRIVDFHHGLPIYAGGDDVMALVPLQTAAQCAADLEAAYDRIVGEVLRGHGARASFSVGLGIGHVLDPLRDLLDLGREAERLAKGNDLPLSQQRRALVVVMEKRGGQRRTWRARWPLTRGGVQPTDRITAAVRRLRAGRLSTSKLFELDDLLRRMEVRAPRPHVEPKPPPLSAEESSDLTQTLVTLTRRILARSEGQGGTREGSALTPAEVGLEFDDLVDHAAARRRLSDWVELHVIARLLSDATYAEPEAYPGAKEAAS